MSISTAPRSENWKWAMCVMLLLATTLNYMDRQTLASTAVRIQEELGVNDKQYGALERAFGFAYAIGGLIFGLAIVDRVKLYYLFPFVLTVWSLFGFSGAYAVEIGNWLSSWHDSWHGALHDTWYGDWASNWFAAATLSEKACLGLGVCRMGLGFFEAAQFPMALVATSRLLSSAERPLGNSIVQSGTAIGSIFTPIAVNLLVGQTEGYWGRPFMVIGLAGIVWVIPWFLMTRSTDFARPPAPTVTEKAAAALSTNILVRRYIVCAVMVVAVNLPWHFYRAWLPKFLHDIHGYSEEAANYLAMGYYIAADIGCIGIGFASRWLIGRSWNVHWARTFLYLVCAATIANGVVAAFLPAGFFLVVLLWTIGAAGLAAFPLYYSYSQELSSRHQGKVSGSLTFMTWMVSGVMQGMVGSHIKFFRDSPDLAVRETAYRDPLILLSLAPLVALVVLLILWKQTPKDRAQVVAPMATGGADERVTADPKGAVQ